MYSYFLSYINNYSVFKRLGSLCLKCNKNLNSRINLLKMKRFLKMWLKYHAAQSSLSKIIRKNVLHRAIFKLRLALDAYLKTRQNCIIFRKQHTSLGLAYQKIKKIFFCRQRLISLLVIYLHLL